MIKLSYIRFVLILTLLLPAFQLFSQAKVYSVTRGELLFQWANIKFTDSYQVANPSAQQVGNPLRFTCFFHASQHVNIDFNNHIGIISGLAVRNVGFISDERLDINNSGTVQDFKIIRRSYNLGIPLALKLGSFKDHTFIFAGAELELPVAYKEKYWESHSRDGEKIKTTQWFGAQTPTFIPSVYGGIQFPGGVNVRFKYYLENFINTQYTNPNNAISDLTRYEQTQLMYISLSWQFNTAYITKKQWKTEDKFSSL